ncbi:putative methyltransferase domain-containing protein [Trichoderma barbatum]
MGFLDVEPPLVPLSLSLPPLRKSVRLSEAETRQALRRLHEFSYYPIPQVLEVESSSHNQDASAPDSGYASENDADEASKADKAIPLYLDPIERDFAVRWLTGFIGQAWEFPLSDETRDEFVDAACSLLSHLTSPENDSNTPDDDPGMTRRFRFTTGDRAETFVVDLYDIPMQMGEDYNDVGLQTWGASIAFSQMFCDTPIHFLSTSRPLDSSTQIVELGAGTGLVSLVLASLLPSIADSLPSIIATDYHPTVLKNLERNAASHYKAESAAMVQVAHLDWCLPTRQPPLDVLADIIVAADVVYAADHARWLRHCAAHMLAPDGIFWLMVSIRPNGKFAGVCDSIEAIFAVQNADAAHGDRHLKILNNQWIDKKDNIGRADEVGYKLFKIGWA